MKVNFLEVQGGKEVVTLNCQKDGLEDLHFEMLVMEPSVESFQVQDGSSVPGLLGHCEGLGVDSLALLRKWKWKKNYFYGVVLTRGVLHPLV